MCAPKTANNATESPDFISKPFVQLISLTTPDGILLKVSSSTREDKRVKSKELVGRPLWEMPWWRDIPAVQDLLREAVAKAAKGRVVQFGTSFRNGRGEEHFVSFVLKPLLDCRGETQYLVPAGYDITDPRDLEHKQRQQADSAVTFLGARMIEMEEAKKRLQNEIRDHLQLERQMARSREVAEEASRAKSLFLAKMSHEFRIPLNAIQSIACLLESRISEPRTKRLVGGLKHAAEHLTALASDALDISRIEAGALTIAEKPFDLPALARAVEAVFREQAAAKGISLQVTVAPGLPVWLRGDPLRLEQILFNLVGNSLKFVQKGHIIVDLQERGHAPDGRHLIAIAVTDTGPGIASDLLKSIFEPFVHGSRIEGGGTGLGLSITRELVRLMGGSVTVESLPGHGATFTVQLPLAEAEAAPCKSPNPPAPRALSPGRALIVDDAPINGQILALMLEEKGWRATLAGSGEEALEVLKHRTSWDVILMDITLRGMSGLETAGILKTMPGCAGIPVIAITGHVLKGDRENLLAAGMDGYIAKPIQPGQLWQELSRVLDGRRGLERTEEAAQAGAEPAPAVEPQPAEAHQPVDFDLLYKLYRGNRQLVAHILEYMVEKVAPQWLAEAEEAVSTRDLKRVRRACHTIKGSAGLAGARLLQEAACLLGGLARNMAVNDLPEGLAGLRQAMRETRACVLAHLGKDMAESEAESGRPLPASPADGKAKEKSVRSPRLFLAPMKMVTL